MKSSDILIGLIEFVRYVSPPRKYVQIIISTSLCIIFTPFISIGFDDDIDKNTHSRYEQSRTIIVSIQKKLRSNVSLSSEITSLRSASEDIKIGSIFREERFTIGQERLTALGSNAIIRHQVITEGYQRALAEYLSLMESLWSDANLKHAAETSRQPIDLLNRILPKTKRPSIGSFPYKHLNHYAQKPRNASSFNPVYQVRSRTKNRAKLINVQCDSFKKCLV